MLGKVKRLFKHLFRLKGNQFKSMQLVGLEVYFHLLMVYN